jgi:glycine/D-amino acid oxidase-like deaminating enzyme
MYGVEVSIVIFDDLPERKHVVKGVQLDNGDIIECDALVLCLGSFIARFMKQNFSLICPVMPVKGYTFDVPYE